VVHKNPLSVTDRDMPIIGIIVLIASVKNQPADGRANFYETFDRVKIARGSLLTPKQLNEEVKKHQRIAALVQLRNAYRAKNERAIALALTKLFPAAPILEGQNIPENALALAWRSDLFGAAQEFFPKEISEHMAKIRFVVWWDSRRKKFQPALYCKTIDEALYALTALGGLFICPTDDNPFLPERKGQQYCSLRCRERFRQQRRREKLKKEGRKK
jgi:hypothetical protein